MGGDRLAGQESTRSQTTAPVDSRLRAATLMVRSSHSVDGHSRSVLCVSDSYERVTAISDTLCSRLPSYSIETTTDPTVVSDLLTTRRVDCLVSDVEMVPLCGLELLAIVREMESTLPVILVAGDGSGVTKQQALSAGATDFLEFGGDRRSPMLAECVDDVIGQQTTARPATDGGYTDQSAPAVPLQRLVDAETTCEIVTVVDSVVSELPPVSDSTVWLFESQKERLEPVRNEDDTDHQSPPPVAVDAFETGDQQLPDSDRAITVEAAETAEAMGSGHESEPMTEEPDTDLRVAHPLGTVGAISASVDTLTPTVQQTLSQLSSVAGACLEHNREYAQLEQRLHQVADRNRTLSQFARTVAHDLNSPLSVIYGRIELSLAEPSEADIHLQAALNAAQRVDSLITDHLQTVETVDAEAETELVSVQTVATDAWRIIDPSMARLQIEPQLETVQANAIRLQQLFENLIRNAIEHGSEESVGLAATDDSASHSVFDDDTDTVSVTIKPTPTGFAVCDDGPGIPESKRTEVFESGYTTTESGSGLGLYIVSEIVAAHDWDISASESASGGARFDIDTD